MSALVSLISNIYIAIVVTMATVVGGLYLDTTYQNSVTNSVQINGTSKVVNETGEQVQQIHADIDRLNQSYTLFNQKYDNRIRAQNNISNVTLNEFSNVIGNISSVSTVINATANNLLALADDIRNGSLRNYNTLLNATNNTNVLVKFLTDNFGSKSGYLERENFQYDRANKTFDNINKMVDNQRKILTILNQSKP